MNKETLLSLISNTLRRDQYRFQQRLKTLHSNDERAFLKLSDEISQSISKRQYRANHLPLPHFNEELPINAHRDKIIEAIQKHQVIVIAGETGSGKTTQLPQICLAAGQGIAGLIGCTQPRRIAARSIANRISQELNVEMGQAVGFKIRFHDRINENTYIKLMTDGILLAEISSDRFLEQYDTIIIDEAHERSLNIDFLLGYLKLLSTKRKDLKIIITSATIDTARFAQHFNAPIIEIEGRNYPIEVRYRPLMDLSEENNTEKDMQQAILEATDEIANSKYQGDILIFLSGERDIRETAEALRKHHPPQTEILPLYGRLSSSEQDKVFKPNEKRRIVLATNVAETSLTVPRIRAVIDPGFARLSRYSVRNKVQRLLIEKISQASANQRKGRCGRISNGLCIRLYSELDFVQRPEFTLPEILRTSLASVILKMLDLKLGHIEVFPFLEPPEKRAISDGFKQLEELSAVDKQKNLTLIGKQLATLPIDPRIGRMILAAKELHCLNEVLIIAAALSVQDPRERPLEYQQAADNAHRQFQNEHSDFLSYLNLWHFYSENLKHLSRNKLKKLCQENFLSFLRMQEWIDIHQQLYTLVKEHGWKLNELEATYEQLHRALLVGLLSNIAMKTEQDYVGARGLKLNIFPASVLFKKKPKWIIAAELVETARLYARCVAKIEPEWVEEAAQHLSKKSYFEPHWEKRSAQVTAFEQVSLYGLPIIAKRKINYGAIDPLISREIFIREALVNGDWQTKLAFYKHNQHLIQSIEEMEHKTRCQNILVDEQKVYDFYATYIPAGIYSGITFEKWYQQAHKNQPNLLFLTEDILLQKDISDITSIDFPEFIEINNVKLPLSYYFEPAHPRDGITVTIPVQILNQISPEPFEWLVPGLLREKIIALLRSLPKHLRKYFVPIPDFATALIEALQPTQISLIEALIYQLHKMTGVSVSKTDFKVEELMPNLLMTFVIIDEQQQVLSEGKNLLKLKENWQEKAKIAFSKLPKKEWEKHHLKKWDFGDLLETIEISNGTFQMVAYPALVDNTTEVSIQLFDNLEQAKQNHHQGVLRLYLLELAPILKNLRKQMPVSQTMCLQYVAFGKCEELKEEIISKILEEILIKDTLPYQQKAFQAVLQKMQTRLHQETAALCGYLKEILQEYQETITIIRKATPFLPNLDDIKTHLERLIFTGFVKRTPLSQFPHLPRYLKAIRLRLQRLENSPAKDAQKLAEILPLWKAFLQHSKSANVNMEEFRWLLEELRVSIFAPELKTITSVSVAKLQKIWQTLT
ncbi:MAG: ATP-dependent helicase HrpA [Pseudomonadota bacterium]|jgi:ATP-dependent helicase HrpA